MNCISFLNNYTWLGNSNNERSNKREASFIILVIISGIFLHKT